MRYAIVVVVVVVVEKAEQEICEAVKFHIDGLREDGLPVPAPASV